MKFPIMLRTTHENIIKDLVHENKTLRAKNKRLLDELIQSKKNDTPKDPKTGKFTKNK